MSKKQSFATKSSRHLAFFIWFEDKLPCKLDVSHLFLVVWLRGVRLRGWVNQPRPHSPQVVGMSPSPLPSAIQYFSQEPAMRQKSHWKGERKFWSQDFQEALWSVVDSKLFWTLIGCWLSDAISISNTTCRTIWMRGKDGKCGEGHKKSELPPWASSHGRNYPTPLGRLSPSSTVLPLSLHQLHQTLMVRLTMESLILSSPVGPGGVFSAFDL